MLPADRPPPSYLGHDPRKQFSALPSRWGLWRRGYSMWVVFPPVGWDPGIEGGRIVRMPTRMDPADCIARHLVDLGSGGPPPIDAPLGPPIKVSDLPKGHWLFLQDFFSMLGDLVSIINDPPPPPEPPRSPIWDVSP
ncbi:MAG TPA: hypothetical protein VMP01_27170 [Pirellulaceae bacterium]|nr:hypothetical protein [Pirellulaceae bacterium]